MASELCMNCFSVKGQYEVCPYCGYVEGTPPVQPHCLTPGTILGNHFIVGTVIGFGGFGITYKCYDTTLGITVAAKEFYPMGLVNRSPGQSKVGLLSGEKKTQFREQLKRFLMEAQSVAQFGKAKDIVNIYDYFEENGTAYIIMEYIDGILLKDYLEKQGAMPPDVAMSVIMPIIEAVKKIHSKGIIHRDISPDNIFITDENSIKIFDFGAAQLNNSKEGMAGEKVIKVGYSAPEQYRDKNRQGFYTDIYSVGAIFYQMLTGRKPIESTEREYRDRMKSPMELGIRLNSNTDRAVMEAMAVRPEFRYQGIQQFEDALRNKRVAEYPKDKLRKRKRKRNWIIGTAATLVLAMGVGIGLAKTVFKPESEIFDSTIDQETTITIWVENEDQKEQLESLRDTGFKQGSGEDKFKAEGQADPSKWEEFWQENEKVDVKVEVKSNMAEALAAASEDEKPNMYLTDHVPDAQKTDLESLEGVYNELDADEDYAYLVRETYEKEFPSYTELPTGLDTIIVYSCSLSENEENTLLENSTAIEEKSDKSDTQKQSTDALKLIKESDLISLFSDGKLLDVSGEQGIRSDVLAFNKSDLMANVVLNDSDWNEFFKNKSGTPSCTLLAGIQKLNQTAYQQQYCLASTPQTDETDETEKDDQEMESTGEKEADGDAESEESTEDTELTEEKSDSGEQESTEGVEDTNVEIYGNNIVGGVAFRKYLTDIAKKGTINQIEDFATSVQTYIVLTDKNEVPVIYSERYGIRSTSDSAQIIACKRMLFVMMQGVAQSKKVNSGVATTFPIRKDQLEQFAETHRNMADFMTLYDERYASVVVGSVTGDMYEFAKGLDGKTDSTELVKWCNEYTKDDSKASEDADTKDKAETDKSNKEDVTTNTTDQEEAIDHEE